jgi:chemotaxis protein CheZ
MSASAPEARQSAGKTVASAAEAGVNEYDVFLRIGALTRRLHDALRELGYAEAVESAVGSLPDAQARLGYIARLTGEAAERVLSAAEAGQEIQNALGREARALGERWTTGQAAMQAQGSDTSASIASFLERVGRETGQTSTHLTDIILAQGFHDLTGQVINRVVGIAGNLEQQLVRLLLDATPPEQRARLAEDGSLAGPLADTAGRDDVVSNQSQVDELLESLGF